MAGLNLRVFRGRVIVDLLRRGWRPPPLTDEQAQRLLDDMRMIDRGYGHARTLVLTERERTVLTLIAYGNTTEETADELGRSAETVKQQTDSVRRKLGARNTANAVAMAVDQGIIHSASGWREAA